MLFHFGYRVPQTLLGLRPSQLLYRRFSLQKFSKNIGGKTLSIEMKERLNVEPTPLAQCQITRQNSYRLSLFLARLDTESC